MPTLSIQLPGLPPVSHVLKDETITIGRMKGNTIVIEDSSISLMHAKITRKNGDFLLKDLNSTNGTNVNGQPIGEVKLRDLDRVRFAEITCQFLADAAVPTEQQTSTVAAVAPIPVTQLAAVLPTAASSVAAAALAARAAFPPSATPASAVVAGPAGRPPQVRPPKFLSLWLLRYAGAVLAIAVVSVVGWRIVQLNQEGPNKPEKAGSSATLAAAPNALVQGKVQPLVSKDKGSAESDNKPANRVSEPAESETSVPGAVAEQKAESTQGVPQLIEGLKSQDAAERQRAAAALHSLGAGAKEAIPALREALKDRDQDVQMWAALALVNNQEFDKSVVPVLVRALRNENPVLRQVACLSLGLIPYLESEKETVIPALTDAADKDANNDVRKAALSALSIIAPETVGKRAAK
jgi:pSer/pThr/pTyr-binding forkhead associated (FHA) protein